MMVPDAVTYCVSKFYAGSFTEGLALELRENHNSLGAKVLTPAAIKTGFGQITIDFDECDCDEASSKYHTNEEVTQFLVKLYQSNQTVSLVDIKTFEFHLNEPLSSH